jgi:hypothetical protein
MEHGGARRREVGGHFGRSTARVAAFAGIADRALLRFRRLAGKVRCTVDETTAHGCAGNEPACFLFLPVTASCRRLLNKGFYDWWPVVRRRNLYGRLAAAKVVLKSF